MPSRDPDDPGDGKGGEWDLFVGQRVVCIDDTQSPRQPIGGLRKGETYTIRRLQEGELFRAYASDKQVIETAVWVRELCRPGPYDCDIDVYGGDWPYGAVRFRALPAKAVEEFRRIALAIGRDADADDKAVVRVGKAEGEGLTGWIK